MNNVEQYTLNYLNKYWENYIDIIEKAKGVDIDFPGYTLKFKK